MIIKNKKGVMDDFFDLTVTVMALFFAVFFIQIALNSDINARAEITLDKLDSFHNEETLLHYINFPVFAEGKEMKMKDLILLSVNKNEPDLFEQKTKEYFERSNLEGIIAVYREGYSKNEIPLISFTSSLFINQRRSQVEIPNLGEKISSVSVVLIT